MPFVGKTIKTAQLYNDNFNHFFTEKLNSITPEQRSSIPIDVDFKIFKNGIEASAEKLNFNEMFYLLQNVFGCDLVITVSDEKGLDIKDYQAAIKAQKGKVNNGELLNRMQIPAAFVMGGKELMSSLLYMTHVCCTNIYMLVKKHVPNANHSRNKKYLFERDVFNTTLDFLTFYEANKKRISMDFGLTMPEWYALLYFSVREGWAKDFYNRDFKYSYNANKMNLHKALIRVYTLGYLNKRRSGNKDRYVISAKGMEVMNRIFNNVLLKF